MRLSDRLSVKIPEKFVCVIPKDRCWVVHIPFVRMVKFKFLVQLPVNSFPHPKSCQVLYTFCANLLHLLIMWLMVSSLSPPNLHLLFYCILSILASIRLVLISLFCAASKRDYGFPFFATSMFSRVICCLLVVQNVHRVAFHPIFVFRLLSFCWSSCQYSFLWL